VTGVLVMRLLIVGGIAVKTSDAGDHLVDPAREMGVAFATTAMDNGAILDDDPLAVGVSGYCMGRPR
jgi:thiamine pyrophosphate-dependent acetolactate synthase large subunit-like protein